MARLHPVRCSCLVSDDHFLLRFLRMAKFSQLRAQEVLEHFWIMRTNPIKGAKDWFDKMDPANPEIQELFDMA